MQKLQEKLDFLLDKYSVNVKAVLKDENTLIADGQEIPILSHRSERRLTELKNIVTGGTLCGISVMRVSHIAQLGSDIYAILYRELDICQYVLQRRLKSIAVMENGNVLNAIATTDDGVVCTVEIAATLQEGEPRKDKHEIISQRGIACDIVVDAQLRQDSIYLFGDSNRKYTDVDFELYGLSVDEIAIVRSAFSAALNQNFEELKAADKGLLKLIEAAKRSAANGEMEVL